MADPIKELRYFTGKVKSPLESIFPKEKPKIIICETCLKPLAYDDRKAAHYDWCLACTIKLEESGFKIGHFQ